MPKWIACAHGHVLVGDIVRWLEPEWKNKGKRKKKLVQAGSRLVTAAVTKVEGREWVYLTVLDCVIKETLQVKPLQPLRKGEAVRRKRRTLEMGKVQRLPWCDRDGEAARALASSKFVG